MKNTIQNALLGISALLFLLLVSNYLTGPYIYISIGLLNVDWLLNFKSDYKDKSNKLFVLSYLEKLFTSVLFFLISMTLNLVPHTHTLVTLYLLFFSLFLFIASIIRLRLDAPHWFNSVEKIHLAIILMGIFLRLMFWPGSSLLRIIFCGSLSVFLIFKGNLISNTIRKLNHNGLATIVMVVHFILSLYVLVMLFDLMSWPGGKVFFIGGLFLHVLIGIVYFKIYQDSLKLENFEYIKLISQQVFKRMWVYLFLTTFLVLMSSAQFYGFIYGNRPDLIREYIHCKEVGGLENMSTECPEFERLNQLHLSGRYPEGIKNIREDNTSQ